MRALFVMRHAGHARNFEWVIRELTARGHQVHLGFERHWGEEEEITERLTADYPNASFEYLPARSDRWTSAAFELRRSISYMRYLRPEYADADKIRRRAARGVPGLVMRFLRSPLGRSRLGQRLLDRTLRACEAAVPPARMMDDYLEQEAFDLVVTIPLVDGPSQVDWLRSAKAAGIPAVFPVLSWDNLTLKGLVFETPDRTYVWNEIQRREAETYHRIPPSKVAVVGAHSFDHWFEWKPSTSREEFCGTVGLDPSKPFVLYVCSSGLISRDERPLVQRWLERVRAHVALSEVGVLVRPHVSGSVWLENPLSEAPNAAVWPPVGANPFHDERRHVYYDSIYHSAAVVGINTTALIEAAIVGRRTFTYVTPEVHGGQQGTIHFHYLSKEKGGAVAVGRSLDEHAEHLAAGIAATGEDTWRTTFLENFVRPQGLDRAAAKYLLDDLEEFMAGFEAARVAQPKVFGKLGLALIQITDERTPSEQRRSRKRRSWKKRLRHQVVVQRARDRSWKKRLRHQVVVQRARARSWKKRLRHQVVVQRARARSWKKRLRHQVVVQRARTRRAREVLAAARARRP